MANFWSVNLNPGQVPSGNTAVAPRPAGNAPWWQSPAFTAPSPQAQTTEAPGSFSEALSVTDTHIPAKAMSARQNTSCPECGGNNYFIPVGTQAQAHCYECGYNARFTQMASGIPSAGPGAPSTPTAQIEGAGLGGRSNYNPQVIIDHIK